MNAFAFNNAFEQLQYELSRLRLGGTASIDITRCLTDTIENWARKQGWDVWREYDIPGYTRPDSFSGGRLDLYARCADGTGVAVEIDRFDRLKSLDKLGFCAAEGNHAIWIRWRTGGASSHLEVPPGVRMIEVDTSRKSPFIGRVVTPSPVRSTRNGANRAYADWSEREERRLVGLYLNEMGITQIAKKLGRKPGAIRSRLRKLRGR